MLLWETWETWETKEEAEGAGLGSLVLALGRGDIGGRLDSTTVLALDLDCVRLRLLLPAPSLLASPSLLVKSSSSGSFFTAAFFFPISSAILSNRPFLFVGGRTQMWVMCLKVR